MLPMIWTVLLSPFFLTLYETGKYTSLYTSGAAPLTRGNGIQPVSVDGWLI